MTPRPKMSGREAAVEVLKAARGPLHIGVITERVLAGYRTGLKGATPQATLGAQLHVAAANKDTFAKVAPATFDLLERASRTRATARTARGPQAKPDPKAPGARRKKRRAAARR